MTHKLTRAPCNLRYIKSFYRSRNRSLLSNLRSTRKSNKGKDKMRMRNLIFRTKWTSSNARKKSEWIKSFGTKNTKRCATAHSLQLS